MPLAGPQTIGDYVARLRTAVVEASLAWELAVTDERRGTGNPAMTNAAAVLLYKATRAYRAATR